MTELVVLVKVLIGTILCLTGLFLWAALIQVILEAVSKCEPKIKFKKKKKHKKNRYYKEFYVRK